MTLRSTPVATPVALITGAGRTTGIGFEAASQLARQGFTVVLTARDLSSAEARAAELRAERLDVFARKLDVASDASVQALAASVGEAFGRLDVLINNAAGSSGTANRPRQPILRRHTRLWRPRCSVLGG